MRTLIGICGALAMASICSMSGGDDLGGESVGAGGPAPEPEQVGGENVSDASNEAADSSDDSDQLHPAETDTGAEQVSDDDQDSTAGTDNNE